MNVFLRHILLYIYYSATLIFQIPEAKKTPTSKQQDPGEQLAMAFLNSPDSDDDVDCSNDDCNDEDVDIHDGKIDFDVGGDDNGDYGNDGSEPDSFVDGDALDIDLVAVDSWVVVKYDEKRYVGKVKDISQSLYRQFIWLGGNFFGSLNDSFKLPYFLPLTYA